MVFYAHSAIVVISERIRQGTTKEMARAFPKKKKTKKKNDNNNNNKTRRTRSK